MRAVSRRSGRSRAIESPCGSRTNTTNDRGNWFRAHGNEQWEFDDRGLMRRREASINDLRILEADRLFHWTAGPRPADHPGLTELGV
jgi:uncharacterized protein